MILNLMVLGFVLSLDNFRTAVILGPLRFAWSHALKIAVAFGFFDGVAPLIGILAGHDVSQKIGNDIADSVGATALGLYGLYLIVRALQTASQEELQAEHRWSVFGLPLPLSLDNVIAGTGLGMLGMSPLVPAVLFSAITFLMTLIGLQLGRVVSRFIPIRPRWDILVGIALIIETFILVFWLLSVTRPPVPPGMMCHHPVSARREITSVPRLSHGCDITIALFNALSHSWETQHSPSPERANATPLAPVPPGWRPSCPSPP